MSVGVDKERESPKQFILYTGIWNLEMSGKSDLIMILIYMLNAIGLSHGGSSTVQYSTVQ
jgi:hypothetical protein